MRARSVSWVRHSPLIGLALIVAGCDAGHAAVETALSWKLEFTQRYVSGPSVFKAANGRNAPAAPNSSEKPLVVWLEPQRVDWRVGRGGQRVDFSSGRVYSIDGGCVSEQSIFAKVAARSEQLETRRAVRTMSKNSAAGAPAFSDLNNEALLAVEYSPPATETFAVVRRAGQIEWMIGDRAVARFKPTTQPIPVTLRHSYARFLAYFGGLHPRVRRDLLQDGHWPQQLWFSGDDGTRRQEVRITLRRASPVNGPPPDLPTACAPDVDKPPSLVVQWRRDRARGVRPSLRLPVSYQEEARRFQRDNRPLEAALTAIEMQLAVGRTDSVRQLIDETMAASSSDSTVTVLRNVLDALERDPEAANKLLESLPATTKKSYVIGVLRAANLVRMKQYKSVTGLFADALLVNPGLIAVYRDLGDDFYGQFRMAWAWEAWDLARQIAPDTPLLTSVDDLERSLRRRFPDYF